MLCMNHSSTNIEKLYKLFRFPKLSQNISYLYDFEKHLKSKALAILLANADLATPELNRETVKALLKGNLEWPKIDGSKVGLNVDIEIEVFEKLGAFSFFADYCTVHAGYVQNEENLSESIKPFYNALKMIKNIMHGKDFVNPHFQIHKEHAEKLLHYNGLCIELNKISELVCHEEIYKIKLNHIENSKLLPEYLWQALNPLDNDNELINTKIDFKSNTIPSKKEKKAFKKWLLITRVYSDCALWNINLECFNNRNKLLFLQHVLSFIESDSQLKKSQNILENQWLCLQNFGGMLFQKDRNISITINSSGSREMKSNNRPPKPLSLDEVLKKFTNNRECESEISNLACVNRWHTIKEMQFPASEFCCSFYFPKKIAEADIYIHGNSFNTFGKLDKLLTLSNERPELRHILLNVLPLIGGIKYLLYLLRKIETTSIAVYLFTKNIPPVPHGLRNASADSLHNIYFPLVCNEFLDVCFDNKHIHLPALDIVELLICLAKESVYESYKGESRVNKDCLDILLDRFSINQISYFSKDLLSEIEADDTHHINILAVWKFYLLFWLLEKCKDFGLLAETDMAVNIQHIISDTYIKSFKANIDNSNLPFDACEIFDLLPWWRIDNHYSDILLNLVPNPAQWISKLDCTNSKGHSNKRLARNYFQLLLCLYSIKRSCDCNTRIMLKIMGLLETCVFFEGPDRYVGLFYNESEYEYKLWNKFALFIDDVSDDIFNRIVDVLKSSAPVNRILEIYSQINKETHKKVLLEYIELINQNTIDKLSLGAIEESLNYACGTGQLELAKTLLEKGLSTINDKDSFLYRHKKDPYFFQLHNNWLTYEFKVNLLIIANDVSLSTQQKRDLLNSLENPFKEEKNSYNLRHNLYKNCKHFRRTIIAMSIYDDDPETAYCYFDYLYRECADIKYSGNRFCSKLSVLERSNSEIKHYQHALSEWLETLNNVDIQKIQSTFIQNWIYCLIKINDHKGIDTLWLKLSEKQKNTIKIATYYCKSLKNRGEHYSAGLVYNNLKNIMI